ncbi:MAG TPA: GNAT family N-acetyltransferase, partial [Phototrophicaceae bacterium]|nr:GNAT family N-acetyltransferase [Phototrophicaceae bacterium]
TKEIIKRFLKGHPDHPELGLWATIDKATHQLIGRCGLLPQTIEGLAEVEVTYLLDKKYWRQGLGTEAAQAILYYGFEQLHLARLICTIDPDIQTSKKVAMRIGMTLEKEIQDETRLFLLFSISGQPD